MLDNLNFKRIIKLLRAGERQSRTVARRRMGGQASAQDEGEKFKQKHPNAIGVVPVGCSPRANLNAPDVPAFLRAARSPGPWGPRKLFPAHSFPVRVHPARTVHSGPTLRTLDPLVIDVFVLDLYAQTALPLHKLYRSHRIASWGSGAGAGRSHSHPGR